MTFFQIMVSVINIRRVCWGISNYTQRGRNIFRKQISAFLIKIKFVIIQTRFISIIVVNINKSSAQTILFQLNIDNFFWKIFVRSFIILEKTIWIFYLFSELSSSRIASIHFLIFFMVLIPFVKSFVPPCNKIVSGFFLAILLMPTIISSVEHPGCFITINERSLVGNSSVRKTFVIEFPTTITFFLFVLNGVFLITLNCRVSTLFSCWSCWRRCKE